MTGTSPLPDFGRFFYPGPTEVRPEILQAMVRPMISHRGAEFRELFQGLQPGLQEMFGTSQPVCISTSSATGLMEAAVRAVPVGPIVSLVNGAFASRFAEIAQSVGHQVERIDIDWGQPALPEVLDAALLRLRTAGTPATAVTLVHSETSTGALSDVGAISAVARRHEAMILVDSVTGIGGTEFEFDTWDVDFAFTGSQKALAIPPGLSFVAASERLLKCASRSVTRGFYLDILELVRYAQKSETPSTPALPLLFALDAQLAAIAREGFTARVARHKQLAAMTHQWAESWSQKTDGAVRVLAPAGSRSTTVSVIALPPGKSGREFAKDVKSRGFTIASGYGNLAEATFRIGHMGDHQPDALAQCLRACDGALTAILA